jgi:hypothetical protein
MSDDADLVDVWSTAEPTEKEGESWVCDRRAVPLDEAAQRVQELSAAGGRAQLAWPSGFPPVDADALVRVADRQLRTAAEQTARAVRQYALGPADARAHVEEVRAGLRLLAEHLLVLASHFGMPDRLHEVPALEPSASRGAVAAPAAASQVRNVLRTMQRRPLAPTPGSGDDPEGTDKE